MGGRRMYPRPQFCIFSVICTHLGLSGTWCYIGGTGDLGGSTRISRARCRCGARNQTLFSSPVCF